MDERHTSEETADSRAARPAAWSPITAELIARAEAVMREAARALEETRQALASADWIPLPSPPPPPSPNPVKGA